MSFGTRRSVEGTGGGSLCPRCCSFNRRRRRIRAGPTESTSTHGGDDVRRTEEGGTGAEPLGGPYERKTGIIAAEISHRAASEPGMSTEDALASPGGAGGSLSGSRQTVVHSSLPGCWPAPAEPDLPPVRHPPSPGGQEERNFLSFVSLCLPFVSFIYLLFLVALYWPKVGPHLAQGWPAIGPFGFRAETIDSWGIGPHLALADFRVPRPGRHPDHPTPPDDAEPTRSAA
jgi:hypothetical protein